MEQVSPTRTDLLMRQAQIRLAQQGADLLRSKREALVREFLAEIRAFAEASRAMRKSVIGAVRSLMEALAIDGPEAVTSAGLACRRPVALEAEEQSIWGTKVVNIRSDYSVRTPAERCYGSAETTARIDDAAERFEQAVEHILQVAPVDLKLRALAEDMRKTSRRVNALEQRLLPRLNEQVHYIKDALDQREREDIFRLKILKRKMAVRA